MQSSTRATAPPQNTSAREQERALAKRNADLVQAIKLWKKTKTLLDEENDAKEKRLRRIIRKKLAGTEAASILTIGPDSDLHKLAGQKTAISALQSDIAKREESCHSLQLTLERLQQQILAEKSELQAVLSDDDIQLLLESKELEGTLNMAHDDFDAEDSD